MREVPQDLAAHLAGEATTTCHCWRVTRRDGRVLGFTDHDHDLAFAGTSFLAASSFSGSEVEAATGLAASTDEVAGGFSSEVISEEDLAAGLYDGARVERYLDNWQAPEEHMLLDVREVGEVTRSGAAFTAELRSMAHRLAQPQGRVYNRRCDAELGDGRCRVDLAGWTGSGTVVSVVDESAIIAEGLDAFADGFFRLGVMRLGDGRRVDVEAHRRLAEGRAELRFWLPLEGRLEAGQSFTISAGCDKTFATCKSRFANQLNFRGFPHVPGSDFAYSYAAGEGRHDGGPIFP
ncbi:DUF2163 domain-containing protein [Rhizobium halophilum]|uniref:DUF2163 domain-containing protein n=1 Tax=Rhizobium halophilum TaxID=2846852 RepID=UPI001EFC75A3|nr:DUF2163 domain-containing protein [Rhizobium halophilum]MCF6370480.1 DUF2163 domain-containing protein [Rhizobium halophilum]